MIEGDHNECARIFHVHISYKSIVVCSVHANLYIYFSEELSVYILSAFLLFPFSVPVLKTYNMATLTW